jgi:hypothetical protein
MENRTNIYFIGNVELGAVKIGRSNNPQKRLTELQTANSQDLVLYGVIDDVTPELENTLHKILNNIQLKGEWFKLTDKLIRFMVSKTDEISNDYKIRGSKTKSDPLGIAIDKIVKPTKNGGGWVSENNIERVIRRFLILNNQSPHFDNKKLRQKLKNRNIYGINRGGEWIYRDHYADEIEIQPSHYIGPASVINDESLDSWHTEQSVELKCNSKIWKHVKVFQGYSCINSYKDGSLTVSTITTNVPGIKHDVVIYKQGIYNASGID